MVFVLGLLFHSCSKYRPSPNIILIMADDLGWGDVGFNGSNLVRTPHLDDLAKKGIILDRFYAASPVCSPTRASCLTGRHPHRLGITNANTGHLRSEEYTIPEILKKQGYKTGHFGKWHLGTLTTQVKDSNRGKPGDRSHYSIPTMHGYDTYFSTEAKVPTFDPLWRPIDFDTARGESLRYGWKAVQEKSESMEYGTRYWKGAEIMESNNVEGDDSRIIMDRVIPFIESAVEQSSSFFATIWFHAPHLPVVANNELRVPYDTLSLQEQLYFGTISGIDRQVGRLWNYLETLNIAHNTLLWFCSDNGPENKTPGSTGVFRERKRSLYEGGVRVPAFVVWKDQWQGGSRSGYPMVTSDYLPTILDLFDLDIPEDLTLDGVSGLPALQGSDVSRSKPIGFLYQDRMSWVDTSFKLISNDGGEHFELYNLLNDPGEQADISRLYPDQMENMKNQLLDWQKSVEPGVK